MSTPISGLPAALTVGASDVLPIVQDGVTLKTTAQLLVNSQLPIASTVQAGIIQIGVTPGRACDGDDARLSNSRTPSGSAGGDLTGTYPNPSLAALGTAGTYGSTSAIPVLTLDSKGRVASIATSQIVVNADNISSGILDPNRLATSGVAAGTFGSSAQIPVLTVDNKGRVTVAGSAPVLPGNNASDLTTGVLNPARLATSGVSAGTFGSPASVAQFTVDSKGRITSAIDVGISGSAGGTVVAVGATSSTLAISNSPVIYSGALQLELSTTGVPAITAGSSTQSAVITVDTYGRVTALETTAIAALSPTGVISGSYGHPERVAQFTVDANGVLTGATEAAIAISAASVSGLAASATSDTTNAGNIITGTLSSARIPVLASSQIAGISAAQVGSGITSAQVSGLSASQVGAGITSAQLSAITGTGAVVLTSTPTITNANINAYTEGVVNAGNPVGATATLAITAGTVLTATLTSATPCTFTMPAVGAGKSFVLYLKQPTTGTPTTATFTAVAWPGVAAPVITATLARMDILSFVSDGVKWYGNIVKNYTY